MDAWVPSGFAQEELARRSEIIGRWIGTRESGNPIGAKCENLYASLWVLGWGKLHSLQGCSEPRSSCGF